MLFEGAIYGRASTDKQGDTIEHQVQMIKEYTKRINIPVSFSDDMIYEDEGESAFKTSLLQRPAMRKLIEDIDKGLVDIVFFKGISRFARDSGEAITTAKRLKQKGIRVISMEENYDSDKDDPVMFQIYAVMAEQESRKTSIRVSLGNKQKARNGLWTNATLPLGYIKVKEVKDETLRNKLLAQGKHPQSLYPDPETSFLITKIFDLFVNEGFGRKKIVSYLNDNGFKTRKGLYFGERIISGILKNQVYIGDIVYGKTRYDYIDVEDQNKKLQKTIYLDKDEWAICKNAHEPLVDMEVYMKAQAIIKDKEGKYNVGKRYNAAKHPLTGLLRCGICGAPMICQKRSNKKADGTKKEYRYYTCSTAHKNGRNVCSQKNVVADDLEDYIQGVIAIELRKMRDNKDLLDDLGKYNPNEEINKKIKLIEHNIANRVKNQMSLLDNKDLYDSDTFREINKNLKEELINLRNEKDDLLEQLKFNDYLDDKEELIKKMDEFKDLNMSDLSMVREVFHEWIDEVTIFGDEIEVKQKFKLKN
jgi:site-specific DNA recombinase